MLRFGMGELIIVFLIILVLFGARRLPEIGRSLGKAIREFRKAGKELQEDDEDEGVDRSSPEAGADRRPNGNQDQSSESKSG